jgi:hypothetical protein
MSLSLTLSIQQYQIPFYQTTSKLDPHSAGGKTGLKQFDFVGTNFVLRSIDACQPMQLVQLVHCDNKLIKQQRHCNENNNKFRKTGIDLSN